MCKIDTIPPTSAEASTRKQIAEWNNVSESYVVRSEKFMRGVEIMEQMMPDTKEKILSGQFKVRDADMYRLARADFPNRKQIVHEILPWRTALLRRNESTESTILHWKLPSGESSRMLIS